MLAGGPASGWVTSGLLVVSMTASAPFGSPTTTAHMRQSDSLAGLTATIATYVALHRRLDIEQPWPHDSVSSAAIAAHRKGLAEGVRHARADAARGDIFVPAAVEAIRGRFAELYPGPAVDQFRARLGEEGPLDVSLRLGAAVPADVGVTPVPPRLLAWLPALPDELEYRFAGRHLILRDTEAALVVDYASNIVP